MIHKPSNIPNHIAIIMDGNGRWAKSRGKNRLFGHRNGVKAVKKTVEESTRLGVKYLTLYAFSTENWKRPQKEINTLMSLLVSSLKKELNQILENDIRLNSIGNLSKLPLSVQKELNQTIEKTKKNSRMTLTLALNYGGKEELTHAFKEIASKVKNNIISPENVDETIINKHLYTQNLPDVDLLIRTSGEQRISNFLLWKIAYAELYFLDILWPEFNETHLHLAIDNYQNRERRFGKTSEQLNT
ncbi:MAG: isoprenyl transferase [Flavobacteriaceae bacterium]|jgi:undecaprenyl diphosphate synthase|nr:isoprenyl transferase [Flavobacteriaceae bacterium]